MEVDDKIGKELPTIQSSTDGSSGQISLPVGNDQAASTKKVLMRSGEAFSFNRPQEAPVFCPTAEEFEDPLVYINKIRPIAEKAGICKIRPPKNWQPPFAVDVDNFKFTPRIQRLNELEAKTRIKLNFLDQIAKFWELQGSSLKIPMIDKKALDLYSLHKLVQNEGGREKLNTDKKWNRISGRLGYANSKQYGPILRTHYEKILYPFDVFQNSKDKLKPAGGTDPATASIKNGPVKASPMKGNTKLDDDELAKYICQICRKGDGDDWMLLCDGCDDSYHTYCLSPPLHEVPKGEWRCPQCVAEEVSKPSEAFGFEQAQREYSLQQFGEMADQFKSDYFNMPVHKVSSELVEREFWRIVSSIDEDVVVEYGADLHTMDHGSGFPTDKSTNILTGDEKYINSKWNLNNLPILPSSVLGHINADISGMKVPWMYVGMCFATFCWHNEDHWSYSINYLHWGEPKTWYGVPGAEADKFEEAMKRAAPELFHSQPDLLHQLVTIMNPNILMDFGVPVYRMDQMAGEFIITFPRAYHAGFNQGYNFAEAVNFAPADWLSIGRECITHYSNLHRYCVFSHDELVCKMSGEPEDLDLVIAVAAYRDMVTMFEAEKVSRRKVLEWGIKTAERVPFELLPDDERLCDFCKTTCFLSATTCSCTNERLVCLRHYDKLCSCPPSSHVLKFRFTLDELPVSLEKLHSRTIQYEEWIDTLTVSLKAGPDSPGVEKISLEELKRLMEDAEEHKYPKSSLWETAMTVMSDAEKCSQIAQSLVTGQVRTRKSESKIKLKVRDLEVFADQLKAIPVKLGEAEVLDDLIKKIRTFQREAGNILSQHLPKIDDLKACLNKGLTMDVELPEVKELEMALNRRKWMDLVDTAEEAEGLWTVDYLDKTIESGLQLRKDPLSHERILHLQTLKQKLTEWESRAKAILSAVKPSFTVSDLDGLIKEARNINIALPSLPALRDLSKKVRDWSNKVKAFENTEEYPYLDVLETLAKRGTAFPVHLKQLKIISNQVQNARLWIAKCSKVFLKKNSSVTLSQALLPRIHPDAITVKCEKSGWKTDTTSTDVASLLGISSSSDLRKSVVLTKAFNDARTAELDMIKAIRAQNIEKKKKDTGEEVYCVCRTHSDGYAVRCELCLEWFHATCVPLPKIFDLGEEDGITSLAMVCEKISEGVVKYTCPCCCRSRRPKLETILELLESLQELPVKIFEGEVLTLLVDRAMKWMDEARRLMNRADMLQAYEKIQIRAAAPKRSCMKELIDFNEISDPAVTDSSDTCVTVQAPYILLLDTTVTDLENILIEGSLMEITFEETAKLWKIYSASQRKNFVTPDLRSIRSKIKQEVEEKNASSSKLRRSKSSSSFPTRSFAPGLSSPKRLGPPTKRKSGENDTNGSPGKKPTKVQEYDEDCAARSCRQPSGKEVNWVQCESACFKWFHLVCVGLKKSDVKKLKRYQCIICADSTSEVQDLQIAELEVTPESIIS